MLRSTDPDACTTCVGSGTVTAYVGTYGTYHCQGPSEETCDDCNGTGEHYA